jgi:hypothetical protein
MQRNQVYGEVDRTNTDIINRERLSNIDVDKTNSEIKYKNRLSQIERQLLQNRLRQQGFENLTKSFNENMNLDRVLTARSVLEQSKIAK